jgi:4-hydroxyphenylpyruvate dioxygenase
MGLGAPDVPAAVAALRQRGVEFIESAGLHVAQRGALTARWLGGVMFELVHDEG